MFPAQLIVTRLLSEKENFWLCNLTNTLKTKEKVCREYQKHKNENLYKSVMNIIVKANKELFEKEENGMCEALFDIYKDSLMKMAKREAMKEIQEEIKEVAMKEAREEVSREVREEVSREVREIREASLKNIKEKQEQNIKNLMRNAHFTLEQAFDVLMIPEEERKQYNLG